MDFKEIMADCPVIAAVKDMDELEQCLKAHIKVVFILFGTVCSIPRIVERVKETGRYAMVHLDLITGLSAKEASVDFIREYTKADGIISTKQPIIARAAELGFCTVQRFFVIDSMALSNVTRRHDSCHPDFIEILPGVMPKIIRRICRETQTPIIAGGLIADKEDIMAALGAGACAISTTNPNVWFM